MDNEEQQKKERAVRRHQKREAKLAKRLAELGLDLNGDELDNYSLRVYPVREWKFTLPGFQDPVALNPIVSLIAVVCLWGIVVYCAADTDGSMKQLTELKASFALGAAWLYQITKVAMFFFMVWVTIRYGHIKLGQPDDKPEFSNLAYFVIMFAVGAGSPYIVYSVQDSPWHLAGNYYAQAGYRSQDEVDMFAITMTASNWGITNWTHFTLVGMCMSLAGLRFRLPMTFRSCFYPILGSYTWGWIGDFIDGFTIVMAVAGLVSTLCIAAIQVVAGLTEFGFIDKNSTNDELISIQNAVIWVITALSIATVISGLHGTMKHVAFISFTMCFVLMLLVFFMDDQAFLLNLEVQELGVFLQVNIFQNNFWTDAFGQLREGSGRAVDGNAAESGWMDVWIVFFVAWAVTWAPFVGMILACVSRGRLLREVVAYGFLACVSYCILWFTMWGGVSARHSRQALELERLGETLYNNSQHFLADGSDICYDVPQQDVVGPDGETAFTNHLVGVTPVCHFDETNPNHHMYDVLNAYSYPDSGGTGSSLQLGRFLSLLYLLAIPLCFMACSSACSLFTDILASNGRKNEHWARRMFWVTTVGILATIISSAGTNALTAVYAASIASALPFAVLFCYLMQSILLMCRAAENAESDYSEYTFPAQPVFSMPVYGGVWNVMEHIFSFGGINAERSALGLYEVTKFQLVEVVKGLVVPFYQLHQILSAVYPLNPHTNVALTVAYTVYSVVCGMVCTGHGEPIASRVARLGVDLLSGRRHSLGHGPQCLSQAIQCAQQCHGRPGHGSLFVASSLDANATTFANIVTASLERGTHREQPQSQSQE